MSYELYRITTPGHALTESLDELSQIPGQITPELVEKVLLQFDQAISNALSTRVKNRLSFKGKLNTYRFCDNVWTFVLDDVEFKEVHELAAVDKVKIVACDGSVSGAGQKPPKRTLVDHMATRSQGSQLRLYISVVNDVVASVREAFLDEGDEQVLHDLKQLWLSKLQQSKAANDQYTDGPSEQENLLNMYGTNQAMLHQTRQHGQIQQQQQHLRQQQTLQLKQQRYLQQRQQQVQPQLPTSVLNSQVPKGGAASSPGVSNSAVASASSGAPSVQAATGKLHPHQLTALTAGGGQIITLNTPHGQAQFLLQGGTVAQGQQLQISPAQLQQAVQQHQQQAQQQQQQATVQLTAQQQAALSAQLGGQDVIQIDGTQDSSSDENDDDDEDEDDNNDDNEEKVNEVEDDPLNSDDDMSEEDLSEVFDTDNIVACQYDKINRTRNKWRFNLKDGIMNLNGKDYVFQKATGDAEW